MSARGSAREDHSFLVLRENRLAFAAVTQLANGSRAKAGPAPVTLYGPSGTGKSHLVRHAIRMFRENAPNDRVVNITAKQFADELAAASDSKTLANFVRKYRVPTGLFVCEDLHVLDGITESQSQLIALWNELVAKQSRILVTLDRPPGELRGVSPRLVNRIQGGACIGIGRYGSASREKLLSHFAEAAQIPLLEDAREKLLESGAQNGHELSGLIASIRLRLRSKPAAGVKGAVEGLLVEQPRVAAPSLHEIAKAVVAVFGTKVADLRSDARDRRLGIPRQIAMLLMRDVGKASLADIGDFFGGRTHSTVLHGIRHIAGQLKKDETLRLQFDQVCRRLRRRGADGA